MRREEGKMSQRRKVLKSSFTLQNGTLITPLFLFYLQLALNCIKKHQFVEYTPKKWLNSFIQSPVDAERLGDENRNSSVVAEIMKLMAQKLLRLPEH